MAQSMGAKAYPTAAFILSLIAGIIILLGSIYSAIIYLTVGSITSAFGFGGLTALFVALAVLALIFGLLVLLGALMMRSRPQSARTWGIIVLLFSLFSFIGGGGFFIGAILGLVGGILAIIWSPPAPMVAQMGAPGGWSSAPPPSMTPGEGAGSSMGGTRVCASCGSPNPAGTQFCAKCGAPMPP